MNLVTHDTMPPEAAWAEPRLRAQDDAAHPRHEYQESAVPLLRLAAAMVRLPGARCFGPFDTTVRPGERVAILGPSGAGKSTLLKLVAGDLPAREGCVLLDGRDLPSWRPAALAQRRAVLPQSHGIAFAMQTELVVSLGRIAHIDREPDTRLGETVREALALASAGHLVGRRFDTLSGGEQARVMLARVFAQLWDSSPGWLLVDEPLAALDPGLQFELADALSSFCATRGHALVAVLHDLNLALASFDRLWLVRGGQLVHDIAPGRDAVPALESLFGIGLAVVEGEGGRVAVLPRRAAARTACDERRAAGAPMRGAAV
jgi:iron complex transport system ATP-binding protein